MNPVHRLPFFSVSVFTIVCLYAMLRASLLPPGWSTAVTKDGRVFFVNHVDKSTSWKHPVTGAKWKSPEPFISSSSSALLHSERSASLSPPRTSQALERLSPVSWHLQRESFSPTLDGDIEESTPVTPMTAHYRLRGHARSGSGSSARGRSRVTVGPRISPSDAKSAGYLEEELQAGFDLDKLLQEVVEGRLGSTAEELAHNFTDAGVISSVKNSPSALDCEYGVEELKDMFSKENHARKQAEVALELEMRRCVI